MSHTLFASLAAASLTVVAASCTISSSSPDGDETSFCEDWAKAICQIGNGYCEFDIPTCSAHQVNVCTSFVQSLQGGARSYNQVNGQACIKALNDNTAYGGNPSMISAQTLIAIDTTCSKVVVANGDAGAACTADNDCSVGFICGSAGQSGSFCATQTPKMVGEACADPGDQCQGDSYCSMTGSLPTCVVAPDIGGTCSATIPCGSDAHCVDGNTCQALAAVGNPCSTNDDCASGYCDPYAPVACTNGLTFARGSDDCMGILGATVATPGTADAGAD